MEYTDRVIIRIPKEQSGWLRRAAKKRNTTISTICREAIAEKYENRHSK